VPSLNFDKEAFELELVIGARGRGLAHPKQFGGLIQG
jgi:hypothetical protein